MSLLTPAIALPCALIILFEMRDGDVGLWSLGVVTAFGSVSMFAGIYAFARLTPVDAMRDGRHDCSAKSPSS